MLRAIANIPVTVGGISGSVQYNNGGSLDGATGLSYNISSITFTITSQSSSDQTLKISGANGQTAPLVTADIFGSQKAILTAAGRLGIGSWTPTGYDIESTSFAVRHPTRYYTITANDAAGYMQFMRTDSSVGLRFLPGASFTTFGPTGTTTTGLVIDTSLGDLYFTPGASGAQKNIYFGRRTDSNAAVGASCEFWTATGQTASAWLLKTPGGATTLTQLGVNGDLSIKINDATKVAETVQAASAQTANIKENKDSVGTVLSGVSPTGGYFMKLTSGAPAGAGVTGELRFDPTTAIMYCYNGAAWKSSTFV